MGYKIIAIKNNYALLLDKNENEYIIVKDFEISCSEYKGERINYYPNNIYGLFGAIDNFRYKTEKIIYHTIGYQSWQHFSRMDLFLIIGNLQWNTSMIVVK